MAGFSNVRRPDRPGPSPAKMSAPGIPPAPGFEVFGSKVEYWFVVSVRADW
jgi:hypothetical protein